MKHDIFPDGYQSSPPIERSRVPSIRFKQFVGSLAAKECRVGTPTDEQVAMDNPESRALIGNDGKRTFIVHSTTPEKARQIMQEGLVVPSDYYDPSKPLLSHTAVMLAGPEAGRRKTKVNVHAMAYRYASTERSAKVVFAFDHENPGTSLRRDSSDGSLDSFSGTFLDHADGNNIMANSDTNPEEAFMVPGQRAIGYLDLDGGDFVHNPDFGLPGPAPTPDVPENR